ncbi:hypothetical protein E5676_scaffold945G00300 [Cucumis melo var. makuwa]|uniref:Uncharacterized protein n=1 Tax=Cucumis melo var. makuwa TaxID=1194695 RepID=A0A5D3D5L4_CUCMM|nr:hypothetical protein E6C27_scaffold673G00310 [Cucumis melo var. makuwa]TYK18812.1 hypothetical protein E5676_scaffold945G00300 [Cucumis melo var. makuwa]
MPKMEIERTIALQETGVLPTPKNVGENEKYVGITFPDVQNGVGRNVGRNASGEAFRRHTNATSGKPLPTPN